ELARQLDVSKRTVLELRNGTQLPGLDTLLKLCSLLETTPLGLLTETIDARGRVPSVPLLLPCNATFKMREFDEVYVRAELQKAIDNPSYPPLPLKTIASSLGYDQTFLRRKVRDLCELISARYRAYRRAKKAVRIFKLCKRVRNKVISLHQQG